MQNKKKQPMPVKIVEPSFFHIRFYEIFYTVRNGHGNLDLYGKFTKNRQCSFVHNMGKKSHKCVGNFITDAMVILPYLKIYQGKQIFLVNLP
jgi:hypothetical protein